MSILIGNPKIINKNICNEGYNSVSMKNKKDSINQVKSILTSLGIKVLQIKDEELNKKYEVCSQLWARDYFVKIDNKYILLPCNDNKNIGTFRKYEYKTIEDLFKDENTIINNKEKSKLEGGDIIQDGDIILIGHNQRTNKQGIEFIKEKFKNKNVISIKHYALHLDCCLCILNEKIILYSKKYISQLPKKLNDLYICIELEKIVGDKIDTNLALNFLIINNDIITAFNDKYTKLYDFLEFMKYKIHYVKNYELYKYGGGIRCLTQWIQYYKNQKIK